MHYIYHNLKLFDLDLFPLRFLLPLSVFFDVRLI